jgi:hypothetical protein
MPLTAWPPVAARLEAESQPAAPLSPAEVDGIERRIREIQGRAGYTGDYDSWIAQVTPPDLE